MFNTIKLGCYQMGTVKISPKKRLKAVKGGMLDWSKTLSCQRMILKLRKELLDKRGRKSGYRKIESEDLKEMGFAGIDEMASSIAEGKVSMSKIKTLKPWFALAPPRQGFKRSTKRLYTQKGILVPIHTYVIHDSYEFFCF